MAKYITYAKEYVMPKLSERAAKRLTECYLEMRGSGHRTKTVSATPRQL
jgi:DNA replicative helicase MCM subunit Mcm2 (Cdc46/Mcm family)